MRAARCGALLAFALLVQGAAAAVAGPGHADAAHAADQADGDPGVEVSEDGTRYSDDVDTPLFGAFGRLVPGDRESVTLWVRNSGDLAGLLRVSGTDAWSTSAVFASAISITAVVPAGAGQVDAAPIALGAASHCALLLHGPLLEPGEIVPVRFTVGFTSAVTGRAGAGDRGGLDVVVALRDPSAPTSETADCASGTVLPGAPGGGAGPGRGGGQVADTGAAVVVPAAAAALAGLAGSATLALLALRDRRRRRSTR
jgi:hypothetical protein